MQRRLSEDVADQLGTGTKYKASEYCEPTHNLEAQRAFHKADLKLNQRGQENISEAEVLLRKHSIYVRLWVLLIRLRYPDMPVSKMTGLNRKWSGEMHWQWIPTMFGC